MSSTDKTTYYNLSRFSDDDRPSWRGDVNADNEKMDSALHEVSVKATDNQERIVHLTEDIDATKEQAEQALSKGSEGLELLGAMGVSSKQEASGFKGAVDGKADRSEVYSRTESDGRFGTVDYVNKQVSTALGNVYDKQSVDNRFSNVYTKGEADGLFVRNTNRPDSILLTIGDSYGAGQEESSWCVQLAKKAGMNLKNFCIGGKGFLSESGSYAEQVRNAVTDGSFDNANVAWVVVGGSRNDVDPNGRIRDQATNVANNIAQNFPNAKILVVPMLWDWKPLDAYRRNNASDVFAGFTESGVNAEIIPVPWAWTWLLGKTEYFTREDIHPNAAGARLIASYMYQAMRGSYHGRFVATSIKDPSGRGLWALNIVGQGGTITYGFNMSEGAAAENLTDFTIPVWAGGESDVTNGGPAWAMAAANGANDSVLFHVNPVSSVNLDENPRASAGIQGFTAATKGTPGPPAGVTFTRPW